ncbi:disease resistance protein At4g27190-like [Vitis riparia]|uniref:disease resistance protein At4g27190-like n=1 Tax=Vitis riparia TaxID=96939 RepID=UPI00155AADA6|nr:disease resistance protein At4g27190-like [Vitis riparia]
MAENMLSGVGGGAYQDVKEAVTTTGGKILDVKNLKKNYKKLMKEAEELWGLRDDIEKEASRVEIKPATREWITKVDVLKTKVNGLETEYNEGKRKRWRLDRFWSNANFSEDLEKKRQQVLSLLEEGLIHKGFLKDELPNSVWTKNAAEIDEKSSLGKIVGDVLNHLEDKKVTRIGIWGTVGTGKTTIMKHLNDNEKIASMFEIVIWVSVSKEWSIEKLQEGIMQRLELDAERTINIEKNAQIISRGLNEKKCLILLDEVWRTIDLQKVMGIDNKHNHSKMVLASIYQGICTNMETVVQIEVKPLSPPDAWNMFRKKVGDVISSSLIEPTARLVVQECHGLPLLIDRVTKTFKKKQRDFTLWNDGLESLQRWDSDRVEGIEELLERLQVCYEDLKDEEKDCFLHGVLYPEESIIYVDYLLECWRAEGSILHAEEFTKARVRGHAILHELMGVSFLEKTEKRKYVKMNKVLRSLALKISMQKDYKYLAKPREGLQEFPDHEECSQASKISLMDNRLHTLPETLDCGSLSTLFLQRNKDLSVIPQLFFQSMCSLLVLDLQGTGIAFLPSSISNLVLLRGLYLNSCIHLTKVPSEIEALQHLEVLDIRGSRLNLGQIQSLVWLKSLRISLSDCCIERTEVLDIQRIRINFNPIRIPILLKGLAVSLYNFGKGNHTQEQSGVISRFVSLEELSIDVDSSQQLWETVAEEAIEEIAKLNKLTSLRLYFPRVDHLRLFVTKSPVWNSRFTFQFSVGYEDSTHSQIF